MHLHFERNINTKCDCSILSLSWMGKVPDDIPEDDGWKLNRTNYYQEGWLATGNIRGIVGVTFTTSHCKKNVDYPLRTNYNLRGHRSDVILVKWNEPYQKLASCDSSGIIFVWIKYEGRWSIELINDRNTPVTHFSWSHDGRMALICYQDGFVLVGSVAGQRYWSSMLNLESTITCGIWTPDDQQVYFGTTQGQIIVMDVHGAMVSQVQICLDVGITSMAWSCEKFKMEEGEDTEPGVTNASKRTFVLAVGFQNGFIYLLKSYDDVSPVHIKSGINGVLGFVMEWSNSRELLAVAGSSQNSQHKLDENGLQIFENILKFYTENGTLLYTTRIPNASTSVSAITWGHNDKRLFIAIGTHVHIAWVSRRVASLQLLCRLQIQASIESELILPLLPLPSRIKSLIGNLFAQTIRCCVPNSKSLREFVSRPPVCSTRLHCTMIRHDDDSNLSSGTCYTLYLEYLGGLVPLLKGKRISKIRPEFVIFDPQVEEASVFFQYSPDSKSSSGSSQSTTGINGRTSSDSELDEKLKTGSPQISRKRKIRYKKRNLNNSGDKSTLVEGDTVDELAYVDTLPEDVKLVEVTSNIWGTKFKIHGLAKTVPANLGQVTYKTSLLHLQPRQMTLTITELRDDFPTGPDPNFNPNLFSEDEDDPANLQIYKEEQVITKSTQFLQRRLKENALPIAPMTPKPNRFQNLHSVISTNTNNMGSSPIGTSPLAKAESYDDDSPEPIIESNIITSNINNIATNKPARPKNIENYTASINRPSSSYTNFKNQYNRSSSNSSCQSRHAISPLCCEGSVPTLQSPKNAVAPCDTIFDRPPVAGQTTMLGFSSNNDYSNNIVQVKNNLMTDQSRSINFNINPVSLNLNLERIDPKITKNEKMLSNQQQQFSKKKEMLYIDEETKSPICGISNIRSSSNDFYSGGGGGPITIFETSKIRRTPTLVSIAPASSDSITRSCSVGYLDSVEITPSDEALSMLRKDAPKRLVLVDRKTHKKKKNNQDFRKPKLQQSRKSKSLDSCDTINTICKLNFSDTDKVKMKLNEISETSTGQNNKNNFDDQNNYDIDKYDECQKFKDENIETVKNVTRNFLNNKNHASAEQNESNKMNNCNQSPTTTIDIKLNCKRTNKSNLHNNQSLFDTIVSKTLSSTTKKKTEIITSFTDSPLFTRKHRFGRSSNNNNNIQNSIINDCKSNNNLSSKKNIEASGSNNNSNKHNNINNNNNSNNNNNNNNHNSNNNNNNINNNNNNNNNSNKNNNINNNNIANDNDVILNSNNQGSAILGRKIENSFSLVKQLSDARKRRKEAQQLQQQLPRKLDQQQEDINGRSCGNETVEVLSTETKPSVSLHTQALTTLENIISRLRDLDEGRLTPPSTPQRLPRSSPATPAPSKKGKRHQSASPIRQILNSPLLNRRNRKKSNVESSDDEGNLTNGSGEESSGGGVKQYRDLETFQKAQLRQKLKRGKIEPNGFASVSNPAPLRREFVMHNKAPMWNEMSQVYQLDFGGRVTQESAKNFQIEFRGKQVMQFGRIDGNAYTLDFQYPFSALQAFSVALANVTQRLK